MSTVSSPGLSRLVFPLLLASLVVLNGVFVSFQPWFGDFWHHAALVGALQESLLPSRDPFVPDYPALIPYWPYAALVAGVADLSGLTAIEALVLFSFFNLTFMLFALRHLVRSFAAPDWSVLLLFVLLLGCWGSEPPDFSAFFHISVFFFVLSYPSTFAFSLTLWCYASIRERFQKDPESFLLAPQDLLFSTVILLVHPLMFIFLCALLAGLLITRIQRPVVPFVCRGALLLGVPLFAWLVWPPFPLLNFLRSPDFASDPSGEWIYTKASETLGIAAFAVLLLKRKTWRSADLECTLVILLSVFCYGYFSREWNYGRSLSFSMVVIHILILRELFEPMDSASRLYRMRRLLCFSMVFFSSLYFVLNLGALFAVQYELQHRVQRLFPRLNSLERDFRQDGLIMADAEISKILPAIGAKVFVFDVAPFFRGEFPMRLREQQKFFDPWVSGEQRLRIAKDFEIRSVIIDRRIPVQDMIRGDLRIKPDVQEQDLGADFSLLKIRSRMFR